MVRRGERVLQASHWDQMDLPRLRQLIESAFGRSLLPDYFERTPLHAAYVSENYGPMLCHGRGARSHRARSAG